MGTNAARLATVTLDVMPIPALKGRLQRSELEMGEHVSASDLRRGASDGEIREDARDACPRDGGPIGVGPTGRDAAGGR